MKKFIKFTTIVSLLAITFIFNPTLLYAKSSENEYSTIDQAEHAIEVLDKFYQNENDITFFNQDHQIINDLILSKKELYFSNKNKFAGEIMDLIASSEEYVDNLISPSSIEPGGGGGGSGATYLTKNLVVTDYAPNFSSNKVGYITFIIHGAIKVGDQVTWIDQNPKIDYDWTLYSKYNIPGSTFLVNLCKIDICLGCQNVGFAHYTVWYDYSFYIPGQYTLENTRTYINANIYARDHQWFNSAGEFYGYV